MTRQKFPVAVHLFLRDGEKILLSRRFNTGYQDGNYSVIAGHVDGGEDVYSAMMRECKEEAGIDISRNELRAVHVMHRKTLSDERVDWFFECKNWTGEVKNTEPEKCDELRWVEINLLPENTIDYIVESICHYTNNIPFSSYGW